MIGTTMAFAIHPSAQDRRVDHFPESIDSTRVVSLSFVPRRSTALSVSLLSATHLSVILSPTTLSPIADESGARSPAAYASRLTTSRKEKPTYPGILGSDCYPEQKLCG
jgi:hypothetical protein